MKSKNSLLLVLSVVFLTSLYAQNENLPLDRTKIKPTENKNWKELPQFSPNIDEQPNYWHTLEHQPDDTLFWNNVIPERLMIIIKEGYTENDLSTFFQKHKLDEIVTRGRDTKPMNFVVAKVLNATPEKVLKIISSAKNNEMITCAEPDGKINNEVCPPNDPLWGNQWGPYKIWTDSAWCYTTGNSKNWIAVIDNGVDWLHPDLYDNVWEGWDFADNDANPSPDNPANDHGTHVAGIIGATINNGIGISGMINDTIYAAKVLDINENQYMSYIVNALNTISNIPEIKVINMSLGTYTVPNTALENACQNAWNNGKLICASAGNSQTNAAHIPSDYASVISVGSIDNTYNFSWAFSNYGNNQELTAPGGDGLPFDANDIYSTITQNSYTYYGGTSMASPHVAGLAGLMFAINPCMTNSQARTILQQTSWDLGNVGWDQYYGYGLIYAPGAVINSIAPIPTITPNGATSFCQGGSVTLTASAGGIYLWSTGATTQSIAVNQSGVYWVNVCGVQSSNTIVSVYSNPTTPTITQIGNSLQSTSATTYQWYLNGNPIGGATNQIYTPTQSGNYTVKITNPNGCEATSSPFTFTYVGLSEIYTIVGVNIIPNPNNGAFKLELNTSKNTNIKFKIFDMVGKLLQSEKLENINGHYQQEVNVNHYPAGIYTIQLISDGVLIQRKLIIQ